MSQISTFHISGFYDEENYKLSLEPYIDLELSINKYLAYLDTLFNIWNQNYNKLLPTSKQSTIDLINLKLIYIVIEIKKNLATIISILNKNKDNFNFKDKSNEIYKEIWELVKPSRTPINVIYWWNNNRKKLDPSAGNPIDLQDASLSIENKLNNIMEILKEVDNIKQYYILTQANLKPKDSDPGKAGNIKISFIDSNINFIKFRIDLLDKNKNWPPIIESNFNIFMATPNNETKLYIPNQLEFNSDHISKYIKNIQRIYQIKKEIEYIEERGELDILLNEAITTRDWTYPQALTVGAKTQLQTSERKKIELRKKNYEEELEKLLNSYNNFRNLSDDDEISILENPLNIFMKSSLVNNFKDFIKINNKENNTDKDKKTTTLNKSVLHNSVIENNIKEFINILNKLKLNTIEWGEKSSIETYKFKQTYFSVHNLLINNNNTFILELNLNLERLIVNNYIKYILNFISIDPQLKNIRGYPFKISDSIPESTNSDKIFLPPLIYEKNISNPEKINCCFVLITPNDIKNFNKKYPSIRDKEIFLSSTNIDNLMSLISDDNSISKKQRYKNPNAFNENIKLISSLFFAPYPLDNNILSAPLTNLNKIYYNNKPFFIKDFKILNLPNVDTYYLQNTIDSDKKEINKIYTVSIELTVINGEKPLTLSNFVSASCPTDTVRLQNKYSSILNKANINLYNNFYKKKKKIDRWHLDEFGKLQKGGKKTKKYINNYRKNKKYTKKKYTKGKFKKINKKSKKKARRKKYSNKK